MRHLILAVFALSACAYHSSFKKTNFDVEAAAKPAKQVQVVNELGDSIEIGRYRGRAPSNNEVIDAAKSTCGQHGGNRIQYVSGPTQVDGRFEVEAICAIARGGSARR